MNARGASWGASARFACSGRFDGATRARVPRGCMLTRVAARRIIHISRRLTRFNGKFHKAQKPVAFAAASTVLGLCFSPIRWFSDMSSSNPTQFVDSAIEKDTVVVFSKTYCPSVKFLRRSCFFAHTIFLNRYCTRVKGLFNSIGVKAVVYELDTMSA